jgi:hypothetical protein
MRKSTKSRTRSTQEPRQEEDPNIIHQKQRERYWFDIQFGFVLRNIETQEIRHFYPSDNTSYFNEGNKPMVNVSVNEIISSLSDANIKESIKRPNSKWAVEQSMNMYC